MAAIKTIAALAGLIGALALLSGSAGSANDTARLQGVGFADRDIMSAEPGEAATAADRDLQAGADTIAITFSVTAGLGQIADADLAGLCTAAGLASARHFDLLARVDIRKVDGNFGFVPRSDEELATFEAALEDMVTRVIGPNGCAKDLRVLYIAPSNELDNELYDEGQFPLNTNWQAPIDAVRLNSYVYPRLHALAQALGKTVKIVGGELDQTWADRFLKKTKAFMKKHHWTQPQMDVFAEHLYVQRARPDSHFIAYRNILRIVTKVRAIYGANVPVWYTEVGAISTVPAGESQGYAPLPDSLVPMSPKAQGQFYAMFLRTAACLGVARVLLWHMVDDGTEMRTGLVYLSGRPKMSYDRVAPVMKLAASQRVVC